LAWFIVNPIASPFISRDIYQRNPDYLVFEWGRYAYPKLMSQYPIPSFRFPLLPQLLLVLDALLHIFLRREITFPVHFSSFSILTTRTATSSHIDGDVVAWLAPLYQFVAEIIRKGFPYNHIFRNPTLRHQFISVEEDKDIMNSPIVMLCPLA
jgi:hypothetical protein